MKKLPQFIVISTMILTFAFAAKAQNAVSEEKRKLIGELIVLTKVDRQTAEITDKMLAGMDEIYPILVKRMLERDTNLTPAKKAELEKQIIEKAKSFSDKFRERLPREINYKQYIEETIYPIYDKFFTENELKDLVAFYKTPTGQKIIETMPQLFAESLRASQETLLPKILKLIDEILKEEFDSLLEPQQQKNK